MTKKDPKIDMINEVIFLTQRLEEIYKYHPKNPNQVNVVQEYNNINDRVYKLETEIKRLESLENNS
jgi:uncharacterized protein YdcH (DUF465 family)|tara:strand:+ start:1135 stop:1332 length:198 start_codon:yes stop_codon:yes gene_type:complete